MGGPILPIDIKLNERISSKERLSKEQKQILSKIQEKLVKNGYLLKGMAGIYEGKKCLWATLYSKDFKGQFTKQVSDKKAVKALKRLLKDKKVTIINSGTDLGYVIVFRK
ncbi:hypothetical protein OAR19_00085 [bacterium]|nr:hypothetical protein [bacterium]MDC0977635.1 hypothetical protein [bacterium]